MPDRTIEAVHPDRLAFVIDLGKKFTDQIGFLPKPSLEFYAANNGVLCIHENDEPAGFVVGCNSQATAPRVARIYQAAIHFDLRRRQLGLAVVSDFCRRASTAGAHALTLWCAAELEANQFWQAAGFILVEHKPGGAKRRRNLNRWEIALSGHRQPESLMKTQQEALGSLFLPSFDL